MDRAFPNVANGDATDNKNGELRMPAANVARIMRRALPPNAKISEEAKKTVVKSVTEYIRFITGEANGRCKDEQRQIVTADDLLQAMSCHGLDDNVELLNAYMLRFRESDARRPAGEDSSRGRGAADGPASSSNVPPGPTK